MIEMVVVMRPTQSERKDLLLFAREGELIGVNGCDRVTKKVQTESLET